jgi:hypothetical protein
MGASHSNITGNVVAIVWKPFMSKTVHFQEMEKITSVPMLALFSHKLLLVLFIGSIIDETNRK